MDSDLPPCTQPPANLQDVNKFSVLPLTKSGRVDILYIDKLRQHESPNKSFIQFCLNKNFLQQMIDSGLEFGYPSHFTNSILEDRFELLLSLQLWNLSFLSHKLTFDIWVISSKHQTDQSVSNETNSNILHLLQEASNTRSVPNFELNEISIKKLQKLWSSTLNVSHNLSFDSWIRDTELSRLPNGPFQSPHPVEKLLQYNGDQIDKCKTTLIEILPSSTYQDSLSNLQSNLTNKLLWDINYMKYYIPPYPHLPYGFPEESGSMLITEDEHSTYVAWRMVRESFLDRITSQPSQLFPEIKSLPLVRMYLASSRQTNQEPGLLPIPNHILVQHISAHTYTNSLGSTNRLAPMEFYDLFVRPIEFLFSIGMPLHQLLCKASSSYPCRLELFREALRLSGHIMTQKFQATPHTVFEELSKIRYLHPSDVLPSSKYFTVSSPISRAPPLPIFANSEIQFIPEIPTLLFSHNEPLNQYVPHPYFHIPADIQDEVMKNTINSRPLTLQSENELHFRIIQAYSEYEKELPLFPFIEPNTNIVRLPHYNLLETPMPKTNSITLFELTWTPSSPTPPPLWIKLCLSSDELERMIDHSSYTPQMKQIFLRTEFEGQISLETRTSTGFIFAKKNPSQISIRSNLTIHGEVDAKDVSYKISFPNFRFLVQFFYKFSRQRLQPRDKDWNTDSDFMFPILEESSTTANFSIKCSLSRHKERLVQLHLNRKFASRKLSHAPIVFPWVHTGGIYKILKRLEFSLDPLPTRSDDSN